jgi:hypothetical protein
MFGSSFPPVVCRRADVSYLCLFVYSDVQHILCCVFVLFFLSCVPNVASFSGLSIRYLLDNVYLKFI